MHGSAALSRETIATHLCLLRSPKPHEHLAHALSLGITDRSYAVACDTSCDSSGYVADDIAHGCAGRAAQVGPEWSDMRYFWCKPGSALCVSANSQQDTPDSHVLEDVAKDVVGVWPTVLCSPRTNSSSTRRAKHVCKCPEKVSARLFLLFWVELFFKVRETGPSTCIVRGEALGLRARAGS